MLVVASALLLTPPILRSAPHWGMYWEGLRYWRLVCTRPSFRPADTFLPIREKGLTYKQFCIAIHFLNTEFIHTPVSLHKGKGECRYRKAYAFLFLKTYQSTGGLQVSPLWRGRFRGGGWSRAINLATSVRPPPHERRGGRLRVWAKRYFMA